METTIPSQKMPFNVTHLSHLTARNTCQSVKLELFRAMEQV